MASIRAGVVGAAGYTGGELCRLLLGHPAVRAIYPVGSGDEPFDHSHPNLRGCGLEFIPRDALAAREPDVVFFCTPSGVAMREAGELLAHGVRVVDLSADFRFADAGRYQQVHGLEHAAPNLLASAACGITELYREQIAAARLVANPGCYATAAVLALVPLLRAGYAQEGSLIHLHAVNGTTGAGRKPKRDLLHAEVHGSMLPYSLEGHRHGPEIEDRLAENAAPAAVELSTAHGNFARGIHLQLSVGVAADRQAGLDRTVLAELYQDFYGPGHTKEHFVRVIGLPRRGGLNAKQYDLYPRMADVVGSNFCDIGVDYNPERPSAKIVAAIDNLVKGAAGSAIQNMNVMFGLGETAGLTAYGL